MKDIEIFADTAADLITLWAELDELDGPEPRNLPDLTASIKAALSDEPF